MGYVPAINKNLSFLAETTVAQRLAPSYTVASAISGVNSEYKTRNESYYRLRAKYKISDVMDIQNNFYHTFEGIFEESRDSSDRGSIFRRHRMETSVRFTYHM